ncbi:MAG: M28 family peptidase [Thermoplasmata archaeon]|nr:MAG: M28 family peptidase [Thermoplasmata archaeon]
MSKLKKFGPVIIVLVVLVILLGFLGGGLEFGRQEQEPYVKLAPLTAQAGSVCSFELESNLESLTVSVPSNILIVEDNTISSNSTMLLNKPIQTLQLLLPPTATDTFSIKISSDSFEDDISVSVEPDAGSLVSGDEYYSYMRTFTSRYAKRSTGFPHMTSVANYLKQELSSFGLETEIQQFQRESRDVMNVVGYHWGVERPKEWIVLGGHYDIKEKTIEGAYDNAAGTIAVLEVAKAVSMMKTDRTIVFCLWSGEEQGLWGSSHFAENIPDGVTVKTYLNYDMVGLNWPQLWQLNVLAGPDENENEVENPELLNISNRVINDILGYPSTGFDVKETSEGSSDQASFWPIGVPTIYYAGKIVYFGYHNKADDLATMVAEAPGLENLKGGFETVVWVSYYTVILLDCDELVKQVMD